MSELVGLFSGLYAILEYLDSRHAKVHIVSDVGALRMRIMKWYTEREEIEHCLAKLSIDRNPDGSISDVQSTIHVKYK